MPLQPSPLRNFGPGAHEWGYWDREIERLLGWLPLKTTAPETIGTAGQAG